MFKGTNKHSSNALRLFILAVAVLLPFSSLLLAADLVGAQTNPSGGLIDAFTFYIPYRADILDDQFEFTLSDPPPDRPPPLFDVDIVFIISIAIDRQSSIILPAMERPLPLSGGRMRAPL